MYYLYEYWYDAGDGDDELTYYVLHLDEEGYQKLKTIIEKIKGLQKEVPYINAVMIDPKELSIIVYEIPGTPENVEIAKQAKLDAKVEFEDLFPIYSGYPAKENPFQAWLDRQTYISSSTPHSLKITTKNSLFFKMWPWEDSEMELDWDEVTSLRATEYNDGITG